MFAPHLNFVIGWPWVSAPKTPVFEAGDHMATPSRSWKVIPPQTGQGSND